MLVIVPNELRDAIQRKLGEALKDFPECSKEDRQFLYQQILKYYNEHGVVPDFQLKKN